VSEVRQRNYQQDEIDHLIADYNGDVKTLISSFIFDYEILDSRS